MRPVCAPGDEYQRTKGTNYAIHPSSSQAMTMDNIQSVRSVACGDFYRNSSNQPTIHAARDNVVRVKKKRANLNYSVASNRCWIFNRRRWEPLLLVVLTLSENIGMALRFTPVLRSRSRSRIQLFTQNGRVRVVPQQQRPSEWVCDWVNHLEFNSIWRVGN